MFGTNIATHEHKKVGPNAQIKKDFNFNDYMSIAVFKETDKAQKMVNELILIGTCQKRGSNRNE